MIYLIFLVFTIIIIFLLFDKCNEAFTISTLTKRISFNQDKLIEITDLPLCNKIFKINYNTNINTIDNNNKSVMQNIVEPMIQTLEINGITYNLSKIEWKISCFSWQNKQVGIDLHLVHTNYNLMTTLSIVIPLDLLNLSQDINSEKILNKSNELNVLSSSNNLIEPIDLSEGFKNVYYKKMDESFNIVENIIGTDQNTYAQVTNDIDKTKYFNLDHNMADIRNSFGDIDISNGNPLVDIGKFNLQYNKKYDINKYSINKLLNNTIQIPTYHCCSTVIGPIIELNLCHLKKIIDSNSIYHILEQENGDIKFIAEPSPFDETIGLYIRNNIKQDVDIKYLIPNQ